MSLGKSKKQRRFETELVTDIKSRRLRLAGQVTCMGESRNAYRVLVGSPEGKIFGEDNIRMVSGKWNMMLETGLILLRIGTNAMAGLSEGVSEPPYQLKPFNEDEFIKRCLIIMADELCPQQVGAVEAIRLSRRTVVRRLQYVRMGYVVVITEDVQNVHLLLEYRPHIDVSLTCEHDPKLQEYCACPQNMPQFDSEGIPNQAPETNKPMILNAPQVEIERVHISLEIAEVKRNERMPVCGRTRNYLVIQCPTAAAIYQFLRFLLNQSASDGKWNPKIEAKEV
ncbi:hypothetical protein ANN_20638 [Periplaneta americana]|uniref:Uncharacterized protein n=1 Tax=Periplaneta americana TaxID=6978 RepID=A0ABQ8SD62_PERAM|nr:hypothetical protein ANN_20638 [Periplaneta americana]